MDEVLGEFVKKILEWKIFSKLLVVYAVVSFQYIGLIARQNM